MWEMQCGGGPDEARCPVLPHITGVFTLLVYYHSPSVIESVLGSGLLEGFLSPLT